MSDNNITEESTGYKIQWDRFGRAGEDDDRARGVIAEVFSHVRGRSQPDEIDQAQAVHAVNALNNAGAAITWPNDVTASLAGDQVGQSVQ